MVILNKKLVYDIIYIYKNVLTLYVRSEKKTRAKGVLTPKTSSPLCVRH